MERENKMVQLLLLDDALYPTLNEHPVSKGHNPLNCISFDVTNTTSLVESHENWAQRDASINVPVFLLSNVMSLVPKAHRTRAHLSRVLVIRDKLDRQNVLVCGQHLRHFRHS